MMGTVLTASGSVLGPLRRELLPLVGASSQVLVEQVIALLCAPDWGLRGTFALWFHRAARLPELSIHLKDLRERADLPPRLRAAVAPTDKTSSAEARAG